MCGKRGKSQEGEHREFAFHDTYRHSDERENEKIHYIKSGSERDLLQSPR